MKYYFGSLFGVLLWLGLGQAIHAQITPDSTLSTTVTSTDDLNFTIENGDTAGTNLFHSFDEFSVPTNGSAIFNNATDIENIFSRVTGSNISNIAGLIQANDTANLFLINPNGIVLGSGAKLNIGGSFFATTAESIVFEDNVAFSAANAQDTPLLSINGLIGLQFGETANPIALNQNTLTVNPGESFGLLGGNIDLTGSTVTTEGGYVVLGSVAPNSTVALDSDTLLMDYTQTTNFRDMTLVQGSAVSTDGDGGGRFQLQGRTIEILDGSLVSALNQGATDGGTVTINATDTFQITGTVSIESSNASIVLDSYSTGRGNHLLIEADQFIMHNAPWILSLSFDQGTGGDITVIANDIFISRDPDLGVGEVDGGFFVRGIGYLNTGGRGDGQGGNLIITANRLIATSAVVLRADTLGGENAGNGGDAVITVDYLSLQNGASVSTGTFGKGNAGDISITATEAIELNGTDFFPGFGFFSSGLFSSAEPGSTGNGGTISITTPQLNIAQGGKIGANTIEAGNAGNIIIRADGIEVADVVVDFAGAISGIVANVVEGASGQGGDIDIETDLLRVLNGGQIDASTAGAGDAGNINIRANTIDISGQSSDGLFQSAITSRATTDFAAGSINLTSDRIQLSEEGTITVTSQGAGDAGKLFITSNDLWLDSSSITAEVNGGSQGNINLNNSDTLILRHGSSITTNARGASTGGNIDIRAPFIIGFNNSDIAANAVQGNGGNIQINTQSLFGLAFRDRLTPNSDITASSLFGINGTVEINDFTTDPDSGLVELPSGLVDSSTQIAEGCASNQGNAFIATGRGGIAVSPIELMDSDRPWSDTRDLSAFLEHGEGSVSPNAIDATAETPLTEATTWHTNANGHIELATIHATRPEIHAHETCATQT